MKNLKISHQFFINPIEHDAKKSTHPSSTTKIFIALGREARTHHTHAQAGLLLTSAAWSPMADIAGPTPPPICGCCCCCCFCGGIKLDMAVSSRPKQWPLLSAQLASPLRKEWVKATTLVCAPNKPKLSLYPSYLSAGRMDGERARTAASRKNQQQQCFCLLAHTRWAHSGSPGSSALLMLLSLCGYFRSQLRDYK